MTTSEMFQSFLGNLTINNGQTISDRYGEITASLNKKFRDTESKIANSLQVGSYGRWTGIRGISDLDMLYIMPAGKWDDYKDGKQSKLLIDTRDAIKTRYPKTEVKVDRLVVQVLYKDFMVEVQPVFEQADRSFKYPDTYNGGSWKITKPREEIKAMKEFVDQKNRNLRKLCKMGRAWKNKCGVAMGGLLIDTLAYNFLKSSTNYDDKSYAYYDWMCRDFFKYLADEPDKEFYAALGSRQRVAVKKKFQRKAKKAYELALEAIDASSESTRHNKWKSIFGRPFPAAEKTYVAKAATAWRDTEQFIDDLYSLDVKYSLVLDCDVSQNGFRENTLRHMLARRIPLLAKKKLLFTVTECSVPEPFTLQWKVLNQGVEAERRDCIRGQIFEDEGYRQRKESTDFQGEHLVECYAIKNGVVVARDQITVPIQ
ncbi:nucleotide-binding domain-containing protein [Vibrio harveyi]|uniref:nucleotide-binding domain-containing protein n=1 Tax=Vibrio harveyi TaxID=669 RepID=UPI003BB59264